MNPAAKWHALQTSRQHITRSIDWSLYGQQRALMVARFPHLFMPSGAPAKLPLAIGIHAQLLECDTGLSASALDHFLRAYTFGPKYLSAVRTGALRYDVNGDAAGVVTAGEGAFAKQQYHAHMAIRTRTREKRASATQTAATQTVATQILEAA